MKITETNDILIQWLILSGSKEEALSDKYVSKIVDINCDTPLHYLSKMGVKEVENHPDFDKVKNNDGKTPKDVYCSILRRRN